MILSWCDFFLFILWLFFFSFILMLNSLLNLLIFSELIWICLYIYSAIISIKYNSLFILIMGLFLLGIATCETAVGLSLIILRMSVFGSINNQDILYNQSYFLYKNKNINIINSKIKND